MQTMSTLQPGHYYHIFNRGNSGENLFYEERNYSYFLQLYARHIFPIADTFAYCLMKNHFHLLVRIKIQQDQKPDEQRAHEEPPSRHFSNLFNAYAKAINKTYHRTGSLFEERFERFEVSSDAYFLNLIFYIHFNPQKHGFVADFRDWRWSSYAALAGDRSIRLLRDEVLAWFGDVNAYHQFHQGLMDERLIAAIIEDDLL